MALSKVTDVILDGAGVSKTIVTATDGTNHFAAVGVIGKDGTNFMPAGDDPARAIFQATGDGGDVSQGAKADAAASDSTSSWSIIALLKGLYAKLAGTLTVGGTVSVGGTVGVSSLPAGLATSANQATEITGLAAISAALDVGLSTRLKPADTLAGVTTIGSITGVVHVDDNAGSLTVDGTVAATQSGAWNVGTVTTVTSVTTVAAVTAITNALPAGTNLLGKVGIDQTTPGTTNAVAPISGQAGVAGNSGNVGATVQRVVIATDQPAMTNAQPATLNASPTGGATPYHLTKSAATTNATSVKGSAGTLYNIEVFNYSASAKYLKLYNKATAPTVGTDVPVKVLAVPPGATPAIGGLVRQYATGVAFSTGIAFALTAGLDDTDATAVALGDLTVNLDYK